MSVYSLLLPVLLAALLTAPVSSRAPSKAGREQRQQENHDYYGKYNKCKYEILPWPREVECTWQAGGSSFDLNPLHFRITFTPESKATNSSILEAAFARYQGQGGLIFDQPTRVTRGRLVEPQFHFEENKENDEGDAGDRGQRQGQAAGHGILLTNLFVTILKGPSDLGYSNSDSSDQTRHFKTENADESYEIIVKQQEEVEEGSAFLTATTVWGALYGLDTFSQLVERKTSIASQDKGGKKSDFILRGAPLRINDAPRYPWRGILLDTSNHFLQVATILRLLDAMSAAKLNVLHWHIMDSYAFPFASTLFPDLAGAGSWTAGLQEVEEDDSTYSPAIVRQVVQYAAMRGVRVIPEVDMPGHGYSWGLSQALQSITTSCPAYTDELGHVDDIPLDPTNPLTYQVVLGLLEELAELFPDRFLHLGGDEVKYGCWNESASIKDWMQEHGLAMGDSYDFYALEQLFFEKVGGFVSNQLGRKLVAWEEVFFDGSGGTDGAHGSWVGSEVLPPSSTVVEVWTGPDFVKEATRHGYDALLAYGWYLDRQNPVDGEATWFFEDSWAQMYLVDPEPATSTTLPLLSSTVVKGRVGRALGGEISMWTEQVDDLNIDSRMWPRAAAAAERLWSPQSLTDLSAAAPRLSAFRCRLVSRFQVRAGPIWSDFCSATADYIEHREKRLRN